MDGLEMIAPRSYLQMLALIESCSVVLTDSGGLQREAFFMERPCVTLRDETEWSELLSLNASRLAGADENRIESSFHEALHCAPPPYGNEFGDGDAATRIVQALVES
jgi:UDP-GlcNAc3NAcA epimerase